LDKGLFKILSTPENARQFSEIYIISVPPEGSPQNNIPCGKFPVHAVLAKPFSPVASGRNSECVPFVQKSCFLGLLLFANEEEGFRNGLKGVFR
jgi:hypothetical protein